MYLIFVRLSRGVCRIFVRFHILHKSEVADLFVYTRFEALIRETGVTKASIARRLGRTPTICQDWKAGKAAAAGSSDTIIVSAAALFVNLESHKNMMEEAGMEVVCGCCRWCREPVRRAEGRYAADGAVPRARGTSRGSRRC